MLVLAVALIAVPACSPHEDGPQLVSSARAADPGVPLYPPLQADAVADSAYEYY
jgi:hypothetical protein